MGRRSLESTVPFLDAKVTDTHRTSALVNDAYAAAFAGESLCINPFSNQLAVDRHRDHPLRLARKKLEARLRLVAKAGHSCLAQIGERLVFFDRKQVHRVAVDLHAVEATEVRLILLCGQANRLQRVGVEREGQMHRTAPLEVKRDARTIRQIQITGDGGGRLGVETAVVITPVTGLADGLIVDFTVRPAFIIFRATKDRPQPLGQRCDLADSTTQQLHPAGVPGVE